MGESQSYYDPMSQHEEVEQILSTEEKERLDMIARVRKAQRIFETRNKSDKGEDDANKSSDEIIISAELFGVLGADAEKPPVAPSN